MDKQDIAGVDYMTNVRNIDDIPRANNRLPRISKYGPSIIFTTIPPAFNGFLYHFNPYLLRNFTTLGTQEHRWSRTQFIGLIPVNRH